MRNGLRMLTFTTLVWAGFIALIGVVVALDLGIFHRKSHVVSLPEALGWSAVWCRSQSHSMLEFSTFTK